MERFRDRGDMMELDDRTKTVDASVFALVTASYLLKKRQLLETSEVPLYLVKEKGKLRHKVEVITMAQVQAMDSQGNKLQELAIPRQWTEESEPKQQPLFTRDEDAFFVRWNAMMAMKPTERIEELAKGRQDFEHSALPTSDPSELAHQIVGVTELAFLANRACMSINKTSLTGDDEAVVKETLSIVQSVVDLVMAAHHAATLFQLLQTRSNGQTLNHIVRVFSTMVSFLVFYNEQHSKGLNQKIRSVFHKRYRRQYESLIPGLRETLNTADNVVRLPQLSVAKVKSYALGALMHDIGKILDLEYFEGNSAFDLSRIKQHPIIGSGLFQRTYGQKFDDARYIIGDHHNYLFHTDGYGLSRWERSRNHRPPMEVQCSIADNLETYNSGQALGFLPAEICAVIDVYDALTDESRQYKTVRTPEETIRFMDENFRASHKIDPILFDIFVEFLRKMGTDLPPDLGLHA